MSPQQSPVAPLSQLLGLWSAALDARRQDLGDGALQSIGRWLKLERGGDDSIGLPAIAIRLSRTREFGLVLSAGSGGIDAEFADGHFQRDRATIHAIPELTDARDFVGRFGETLACRRLGAYARRSGQADPAAALSALVDALLRLAAAADDAPFLDLSLECTLIEGKLVLTRLEAHAAPRAAQPLPRPIAKIDKLLHPARMGIVGVSASGMNFGRIILHNIVDSGYPRENLCIIRPGEQQIDGIRCVESLASLDAPLDLLVVAVPSDAVYPLVDEVIATGKAETVMLIPGSLGETAKSREPAAAMAARINAAHGQPGGGPVFLGANCLGVVSHPGRYDSWFIPLERLPKPNKKPRRNSVLLSQSGAFMITRLSQNPWIDPLYMVASGNQTDLTHGDLLSHFAGADGIDAIGLYIEGFRDGDGAPFARAVRRATLAGKTVVIYKSGRTVPGAAGVKGHTASEAGDPRLFDSVLRSAGAIVTEDFNDFDDIFYLAGMLGKKPVGKGLGAISGAGFEVVGIVDASQDDGFSLEVPAVSPETAARVQAVLAAKKLEALVEVRNPIDINPGADDEAHLAIVEAFAADPAIDAIVVGLDPTAPAIRALSESRKRPGFDISDPKSSVHLLPPLVERLDLPVVAIIDGGPLYDAMADALKDRGVCVFRNCARGTRALRRYIEARLQADALRTRDVEP